MHMEIFIGRLTPETDNFIKIYPDSEKTIDYSDCGNSGTTYHDVEFQGCKIQYNNRDA